MGPGGGSGELTQVELKAFDLMIAQLEESGDTTLSSVDAVFTPVVLRTVTPVIRITLRITPTIVEGVDRSETISESEALRLLADRGELTLEELMEARKQFVER